MRHAYFKFKFKIKKTVKRINLVKEWKLKKSINTTKKTALISSCISLFIFLELFIHFHSLSTLNTITEINILYNS
jgi:hypothetical protein